MKIVALAAAAVACLAMSACVGADGHLHAPTAAQITEAAQVASTAESELRARYCALAPEGRAELRKKLGLEQRLIVCAGDAPSVAPPS